LVDNVGSVNDQPDVVATQNGGFAIVYRDNGWATDSDISLARYSATGVVQGYAWVNQADFAGPQGNPSIAELSNGMLAVTFDQDTGAAPASRTSRFGLFSATGVELLAPVLATTTSDQMVLTSFTDGRLVVAWRDTVDPGVGGAGTDVLASVVDIIRQTEGDATNESLVGDGLRDAITGGGGSDLIFGLGAGDILYGGAGGDFIDPGFGADTVDGGADFDVVSYLSVTTGAGPNINLVNQSLTSGVSVGDFFLDVEAFYLSNFSDTFINDDTGRFVYMFAGVDAFTGGAGSDYVDGGHGADVLNLAGGFDYASYNSASAGVTVNLLNGAANTGDAAGDSYTGVEAFVLSEHADTFSGGAGQNFAFGYGGADSLRESAGTAANDWYFGGAGNDTLYGGALFDLLTGEAGADLYEYRSPTEGGDSILTFETGIDDFRMLASAFGFTAGATLVAGQNFISAANPLPTTAGPTFLYYTSGFLYFDADGTGAGAPVAIAQILGAPTLAAGDFLFF
jgi:Ca2+-binding RTX toxin-like protein